MTQEDKELLLNDLSGRLKYDIMLWHSLSKKPFKLSSIKNTRKEVYVQETENGPITLDEYGGWMINDKYYLSEFIKPYLRPMSSMTEEELKDKYRSIAYFFIQEPPYYYGLQAQHSDIDSIEISEFSEIYDWLNAHHFDYRGLIEKGLAIAVTEENNPYK